MSEPTENAPATEGARATRVRRLEAAGRARVEPLLEPGRFAGRALRLFADVQGIDRAMSLAARFFVALIPLLAVISAIAYGPGRMGDRLADRLGLEGPPAEAVRQLFSSSGGSTSFGIFGLFVLIYVVLSLSRALQRLYCELWGLPRRAITDSKEGLRWVPLAIAYGFAIWLDGLLAAPGLRNLLALALSIAVSGAFWTVTPYLLMGRRVGWRPLLPGGLLTAAGLVGANIWLVVYVPHTIARYTKNYGSVGIALAAISYLLVIATIIVIAAVVAAALAGRGAPGELREPPNGSRAPVASADSLFLFEAVYEDLAGAEADLEALRALREAGSVGRFDAAIVTRDHDGTLRVQRIERTAQQGAWLGLAAGAALAVAAPVALPALVAAGGAGLGAWVGHMARGVSDSDARELGELLREGDAALIVVGVERDAERVDGAAQHAASRIVKPVAVDAATAERDARAAERDA